MENGLEAKVFGLIRSIDEDFNYIVEDSKSLPQEVRAIQRRHASSIRKDNTPKDSAFLEGVLWHTLNKRCLKQSKEELAKLEDPLKFIESLNKAKLLRRQALIFGKWAFKRLETGFLNETGKKILFGGIEDSYMELEKNTSIHLRLKRHYLEQAIQLMDKFPDEYSLEFIGRRAEAYLDLGKIERDHQKKELYFNQAFKDALKQTTGFGRDSDESPDALYKLVKICDLSSHLRTPEDSKRNKIEKGIEVLEKLRNAKRGTLDRWGNPWRPDCVSNNVLGFFYLGRAEFKANPQKEKDYAKGLSLVKECLRGMNPRKHLRRTSSLYSYSGNALNRAYKIRSTELSELDRLKEEDIENFVTGIICTELSEQHGNRDEVAYQVIGREYYDLQHLIEKGNIHLIKTVIEKSLSAPHFRGYSGKLIQISDALNDRNKKPIDVRREAQFISLEYSFDNLKQANELKDESPENKSYRGMCLVDGVRTAGHLKRFKKEESANLLRKARSLLQECIDEKKKDKTINFKDYTRLAECEFRLADFVEDAKERAKLYQSSVNNNEEAVFILTNEHCPIRPEIYGSIAASHFKLKNHRKAITFFIGAKNAGDKSPELASKIGNCRLYLLYEELNNGSTKEELTPLIEKTKKSLEEAIEKNTAIGGEHIYPYFTLGRLSRKLTEHGLDITEFGLKSPQEYVGKALETYNENNPFWSLNKLGNSANLVCESQDNYGLLEQTIILKKARKEDLDKEIEITQELKEKLKDIPHTRYHLPEFLASLKHEDMDPKLSGDYYVMSREQGISLLEMISERDYSILNDTVDYLAFIHSNIRREAKPEDYLARTKQKLEFIAANTSLLNSSQIDSILSNYEPIIKSFEGASLVPNKDAHPENWIIDRNKNICAIDFEVNRLVPIEFDLANLMEYGDYFTDEQKESIFGEYEKSMQKYDKTDSNRVSYLRYLNAVVHRAISLVGSLSSPDREKTSQRQTILGNALNAINKLEERFSDYFSLYKTQYSALKENIEMVKLSMS